MKTQRQQLQELIEAMTFRDVMDIANNMRNLFARRSTNPNMPGGTRLAAYRTSEIAEDLISAICEVAKTDDVIKSSGGTVLDDPHVAKRSST